MLSQFDRRVIAEPMLALIRELQRQVSFRLGGGSALSGAWLAHRLTHDLDFFVDDAPAVQELLRLLPEAAAQLGGTTRVVTHSPSFVRCTLMTPGRSLEVDLVHDASPRIDHATSALEGVMLEPLADMRASKLTCLLSRAEPRDLVDVLFLERAGFSVEADLALAVRKDAGVDPATLAWLLKDFPTQPMPIMTAPLSERELELFKHSLAERLRLVALPGDTRQ